jgi:kynurenine formamidase
MSNFIDLTLQLFNGTRALDPDPITFVNSYHTIKDDGYNLSQVIISSHVGTHIDAPKHFLENGKSLDKFSLSDLIKKAILLDFSHKKAKELITRDEIEQYDKKIKTGTAVLIRTDWSKTFPSHEFGYDGPNISTEAVEYLVEKNISILGVEPPTLNWEDNPNSHKKLLAAEILLVEGLANLDRIKTENFMFYAIPLNIKNIDGFPVRAFAEVE